MLSKLLRTSSRRLGAKSTRLIELENIYNCQNYAPLPVVIERAEGAWLFDVEGKRYLDCLSAYSAVNHGHVHPRIKKVVIDQMEKITLTSRALYNEKLGTALEKLCKTLDYPKGILMNTGVEAGETAIKFARRWAYEVKGVPDNQACVLFAKGNFWGRTIAACGSSDDPDRYHHFGPFGLNFGLIDYDSPEALEEAIKKNPNVAAFMVEAIQGEAGVVLPQDGYLAKVRNICGKYNVLLIVDEVQTGLGRTGKLLCQEYDNVKADLVCLGKSLSGGIMPVSAVVGRKEIFDRIVPNSHGSTFGGNPLASAIVVESLNVIRDEGFVDNARIQGDYLLKNLRNILGKNPLIKEVRGKGLFIAIEVNKEVDAAVYAKKLLKEGLISKQTHETVLRICPPLIIKKTEADFIIEKVAKVFN